MLLSVVMVTWNTRELALQSIESVLAHTQEDDMEVIVVDNASSDGTAAAIRERFPGAQLIQNTQNVGGGAGFNQAMRAARGEVILLMHADAYVDDDVIGRMARYMIRRPELGMLGCELRFPDGRHQHTPIRHMSIWHSAVERFWLYKLLPPGRREQVLLGGYWPGERETEADWLAAIQMVRRDAFIRTGGFDEQFFSGGEESEWARRVHRLGYRIRYVPSLGVIYHIGSASWRQVWTPTEQLRRWHRLGVEGYAAMHGRRRAVLYRLVESAGVAFRWVVYRSANRLRRNEHYDQQARHHKALLGFYIWPIEVDKRGRAGDAHLR